MSKNSGDSNRTPIPSSVYVTGQGDAILMFNVGELYTTGDITYFSCKDERKGYVHYFVEPANWTLDPLVARQRHRVALSKQYDLAEKKLKKLADKLTEPAVIKEML